MTPSVGVAIKVLKPHKQSQGKVPQPQANELSAPVVPATLDAFAVTAPGLAPLVATELVALGIVPREVSDAGVAFDATALELMRVNLWSRVSSRVLVRLASFEARDFATLEKQAMRVPWARVLARGMTARLRVTCRKSRLYHSDAVAERVARGIERSVGGVTVELRARDDEDVLDAHATSDAMASGDAPASVAPVASPSQLIVVRFDHDRCTISADSSGELLHRRGWRQAVAKAPLRETLAAAMLVACEWDGTLPLVDPFCGSGTIGIEAALKARHIAPGLDRAFALEQWPGFDAVAMTALRAEARGRIVPSVAVPIVLADRDAGACDAALANAERAGVLADVTIAQQSLSDTDLASFGRTGLVLTNPPYGLRVTDGHDLRSLYARLGDVLREGGTGWRLAMLVPDRQLAAQLRMPMETKLRTSNGGIGVSVEMTRAVGARQSGGQSRK